MTFPAICRPLTMTETSKDPNRVPDLERTPKEAYRDEKEEREAKERLRREQRQQDLSLKEGLSFLVNSVFQFIFYVAIGALLFLFGQDMVATGHAGGYLLIFGGVVLVIKGMMSFGGFNSK